MYRTVSAVDPTPAACSGAPFATSGPTDVSRPPVASAMKAHLIQFVPTM
jgi:hypothetical protein